MSSYRCNITFLDGVQNFVHWYLTKYDSSWLAPCIVFLLLGKHPHKTVQHEHPRSAIIFATSRINLFTMCLPIRRYYWLPGSFFDRSLFYRIAPELNFNLILIFRSSKIFTQIKMLLIYPYKVSQIK